MKLLVGWQWELKQLSWQMGLNAHSWFLKVPQRNKSRKWFFWLCFVFFLFTGDYWIGGLPGPHPHNHLSTTIGWIEVSMARATHRLTVSITTPSAWPRRTLQLLDVSCVLLVTYSTMKRRTAGDSFLALLPIFKAHTWVGTCLVSSSHSLDDASIHERLANDPSLKRTHRQTRDWMTSQLTARWCCCCAYIVPFRVRNRR